MKKHPEIPDVPDLTLEYVEGHALFAPWEDPELGIYLPAATEEEVAYSAGCDPAEVRAMRERKRTAAFAVRPQSVASEPTKTQAPDDEKPWLKIAPATDREMHADQRRHEDGEPWEGW